jgi:hypothetical protein
MTLVIVKVAGKIAKQFAEENYIHVVYINFKIGGTVVILFRGDQRPVIFVIEEGFEKVL